MSEASNVRIKCKTTQVYYRGETKGLKILPL